MRPVLAILFSLLCLTAPAADSVVSARGVPPPEALAAGNPVQLKVELDIPESYHINSNKPLEDYLIPTSLELQPLEGLEIKEIRYPVALMKKFSFSDTPMAVFEGMVRIIVEAVPSTSLIGNPHELKGELHYQACTESMCLPEEIVPVTLPFSVAGQARAGSSVPTSPGGEAQANSGASIKDPDDGGFLDFSNKSLPVILILVFLGGLALDLTPCVYPMIPITISYFGGQAQGRKGSLVVHACLYITGMAVTYSLLGVIAALTGGLLGTALRYPPVLIAIALIMFLLALSMFEVFELRMPGFLNRLATGNRQGFAGTVLMGLTVGIVAAPCIGPFVFGLLTYVGNSGNAFLGFLLFFILSIGMGIPLLVLGIFSGSIHRLPRSGEWMLWVRKVFGFILLAMALFFLRTLSPYPLLYPLALGLLLVVAGVYLAWIARVKGGGRGFAWMRNIVGIGFLVAAFITAGPDLKSYVTGLGGGGTVDSPGGSHSDASSGIAWLGFSEPYLQRAAEEGKPVLIDFYADWCAPCKEYDKKTFTDPGIIELSKKFIMVKVDLTDNASPEVESVRKRFSIVGVPMLVFLRSDGSEIDNLRVVEFEPPDAFRLRMEEAYRDRGESANKVIDRTEPEPAS